MTNEYPVYAKLSDQKLTQLGIDNLQVENSPLDYIDPAWDYAEIFKMLVQLQHEVGKAIASISSQEIATPHSHANLAMQLEFLASSLQLIQQELT